MNAFNLADIGDNQSILIVNENPQKLTLEILKQKPEIERGTITTKYRDLYESQAHRAEIYDSLEKQKDFMSEHKTQKTFVVFDDFEEDCFQTYPFMRPYVMFNRSYSITTIVSFKNASRLPPTIRNSFDFVFVSKRSDQENIKLHEQYFHDLIGLSDFLDYLNKYEYLVIYLQEYDYEICFYCGPSFS